MSPLDMLAVAGLASAAVCLGTRATLMGLPQYGWIARPWYVRLFMVLCAVTFLARAWIILTRGEPLHVSQLIACFALCGWQAVELSYQIGRARELHRAGVLADTHREVAPMPPGPWRFPPLGCRNRRPQ